MPAMLLADGMLGQMMEPVHFPGRSPPAGGQALGADRRLRGSGTHNIINSLYLTPSQLEAIVKDAV